MTSSLPPQTSKESLQAEQRQGRRDLTFALLVCLTLVILVRSFLFEPFKIPSSSMVPTLQIGDHIFVSKFNFGLSIPFTKYQLVRWGELKRGDVIVFLFPRDESLFYVKRVMGLPGDTIQFKGKNLSINGAVVPKERVEDPNTILQITGNPHFDGELYRETIGNTVHYVKYSASPNADLAREAETEVVPENNYFVVGDNRDDSYDSRSWGYVPRENIKGKAQLIWLSLDQQSSWGAIDKIRWPRCMTTIR